MISPYNVMLSYLSSETTRADLENIILHTAHRERQMQHDAHYRKDLNRHLGSQEQGVELWVAEAEGRRKWGVTAVNEENVAVTQGENF